MELQTISIYKGAPNWIKVMKKLDELGYICTELKPIGSHETHIPIMQEGLFLLDYQFKTNAKIISNRLREYVSLLIHNQIKYLNLIKSDLNINFETPLKDPFSNNQMKNLCVIPARKGSKRIKNKNIVNFHGKPIIYYAIQNAIKSRLFDKVIVSTDSEKIAKISKNLGASIPYIRNKKLSYGSVGIYDVVKDVIEYECKNGIIYDYICCVLPTSPMLNYKLIKKTFEKAKKNRKNYLVTCVNIHHLY